MQDAREIVSSLSGRPVIFRKGQGWFSLEDSKLVRAAAAALDDALARGEEPISLAEAKRLLLGARHLR